MWPDSDICINIYAVILMKLHFKQAKNVHVYVMLMAFVIVVTVWCKFKISFISWKLQGGPEINLHSSFEIFPIVCVFFLCVCVRGCLFITFLAKACKIFIIIYYRLYHSLKFAFLSAKTFWINSLVFSRKSCNCHKFYNLQSIQSFLTNEDK